MIRDKRPISAIQTEGRRVHLSQSGGSMITTAPDETALAKLLDAVDPGHTEIGTTNWYAQYELVDWKEGERVLRGGEVNWIEDNDCGRLLIQLYNKGNTQTVTYAPPGTDVAALVLSINQRPMIVRHRAIPEIRWREAQDLIRNRKVDGMSQLHGGRIILSAPKGRAWATFEPGQNASGKFLEEVGARGSISITVE